MTGLGTVAESIEGAAEEERQRTTGVAVVPRAEAHEQETEQDGAPFGQRRYVAVGTAAPATLMTLTACPAGSKVRIFSRVRPYFSFLFFIFFRSAAPPAEATRTRQKRCLMGTWRGQHTSSDTMNRRFELSMPS